MDAKTAAKARDKAEDAAWKAYNKATAAEWRKLGKALKKAADQYRKDTR